MKNIKVLHICQKDDHATGGASRVAVELVKRLQSNQISAECVFVYGSKGSLSRSIRSKTHWLRISSSKEAIIGSWRLLKLIWSTKPDIIHHHDGLIWTHIISIFFLKKVIIGHGHLDGPQKNSSLKRKLTHVVHSYAYDYLFAVSQYTRDAWVSLGYPKERVFILSNGVDSNRFQVAKRETRINSKLKFDIPIDSKTILFVGRLDIDMKGVDDFLRIVQLLPKNWIGVIAGTGPDEEYLFGLAKKLKIIDRVIFLGLIEEIETIYNSADILFITSHYEPFGLIAVEALASGLKVIAFECRGGLMDIMKFFDAPIIKNRSIRNAADEILSKNSTNMNAQRKKVLEHYSWEGSANRTAFFYNKILN